MNYLLRAIVAIISTAALAILTIAPVPTHAQSPSQGITISPAVTKLSLDPGQTKTERIEIINGGTSDYIADMSVAPYHVTGEQYNPQFTQLPGTVDASKWITLEHTSSALASQSSFSTNYTVSVPNNTAPGGYYAVIFAQTSPVASTKGGVTPLNRVGNILYITVNGDVKLDGNVTGNDIPALTFNTTIPLGMTVSNSGGVHFETKAVIKVTDITGKEVFKEELERIILPSTMRDISTDWNNTSPIGVYTIHRQATVGNKLVTLDEQKIVVASPWFTICLIVFVGSITTLLILRSKKHKRNI